MARMKMPAESPDLERVQYRPPTAYGLDLEVLPISELRRRVARSHLLRPHRIEFHQLMCVTRGRCVHTVDFEPIASAPGSVFALTPAQAQQFDNRHAWDGWLVLFRPEFLLPLASTTAVDDLQSIGNLQTLSGHLSLDSVERGAVAECMARMHRDARTSLPADKLNALLRHQLYALLLRLHLAQVRQGDGSGANAGTMRRFGRFKQQVEAHFSTRHHVADYTRLVGCSEKTLTRTTLAVAGVTAKTFLVRRIALEAKRLLAHTTMPIAAISDQLGFDEATNFVKFFKRCEGCVPGDFRRRHGAP